jgi:predicted glycoside hydrolase/deacetylase ChbG (UPF0249 family)
MARLIINADDLGIHPETDRGIATAYRAGAITSATMLVTTPFFAEAAERVAKPLGLPVGLHLSLTLGRAAARRDEVPDLVTGDGVFRYTAPEILRRTLLGSGRARLLAQIRAEFDAQIRRALDHGIRPTHLDSHQHVHVSGGVFSILEELAQAYGIGALRLVREPLFAFELYAGALGNLRRKNPLKMALMLLLTRGRRPRLPSNDAFFGLMYSGNLTLEHLLRFVRRIAGSPLTWELAVHPGFPKAEGERVYERPSDDAFIASPCRRIELEALLAPELKAEIRRSGVELISFGALGRRSPAPAG